MNIEGLNRTEFDWKKWLKVVVGILISLFIVRALVFTLFFGQAMKFVGDFNREFVSGQQAIHNKIEADQDDFDKRTAEFDRTHDQIGKDFQELSKSFEEGWKKHGSELAQEVTDLKKNYVTKLNECRRDAECRKYLTE